MRNRNSIQNTFKDYLVPIVGWVILIILLVSIFWGNNTETTQSIQTSENINPVTISFLWDSTEAFIMYPWDERKEIKTGANVYKWESVIVKEGIVNLAFWNNNSISLNKVAELKYNEDASLSLYSSDAWIDLAENTKIAMRYANIEAPAWSVLSLTQNEASSTIYVLNGSARITNLWGAVTSMTAWEKLSISRQFAADSETDLSSDKWNIDSYFKSSDWFIENDGITALNNISNSGSLEDEIWNNAGTWATKWEVGTFLSFDTITDESTVNTSTLNISGTITSDLVELITINGKQAEISTDRSFLVNSILTNNSVNDIVIKIYDDNRSILDKNVITLYNSNPTATSNSTETNQDSNTTLAPETSINSQWVTTFWVDATDFAFTLPSASGKFSTTASEITIRGITTAENISKVEVNGFKLASFNGSTWRYHAFERFETLESGTNQYKVDYYWADDTIVYTDYYTIVKRDAEPATSSTPQETEEETTQDTDWDIPPEETLFQ